MGVNAARRCISSVHQLCLHAVLILGESCQPIASLVVHDVNVKIYLISL